MEGTAGNPMHRVRGRIRSEAVHLRVKKLFIRDLGPEGTAGADSQLRFHYGREAAQAALRNH